MANVFKEGDRIVLELSEQPDGSSRSFDFQLLSPLLLGLLVPFMAASYWEPEALRHLKWPIWIFLCCMFIVCTGLFFYTHHFPGKVHSISLDREARTLEIEWRNLMASSSQIVPFQDVSALRIRNEYDQDGYPTAIAELVLASRDPIELPSSITEAQLRPLRAAMGLQ